MEQNVGGEESKQSWNKGTAPSERGVSCVQHDSSKPQQAPFLSAVLAGLSTCVELYTSLTCMLCVQKTVTEEEQRWFGAPSMETVNLALLCETKQVI